ncbi:type VII secretion protein EssA [Streptococcus mutans]|uniref:type VII secretion protein EssA n=1 Tax=Streptococcus mutans TaxID=1309 RepID=UPI0002B534ED|nr:type VII secretion protein EssA [Streptococcus mutans]EMC02568.1 hypothetical protein SMU68_06542 [Streptococcus mutans NFSM1]MDT9524103.1 type VII secretion protein EssA [Streptococcus mutans]MDT9525840.1 type VII secretion protein EssA [Streptococcus mutans]MDT9527797.1 type VII secretion protein EssA [Streptococcus mutans]NLQ50076.1 type VII secretion protein EssA [Streptococcus mutans]
MKRFLLSLLAISTIVLLPLRASMATIKDNSLTLDSGRVSQEEKGSLGQQSEKVKDLFKEEDRQKLVRSKDGKEALSSQQKELFQKGKRITTSAKQKNTTLFASQITHAVSLRTGMEDERWNWHNLLLYGAVILAVSSLAGFFTYYFSKKEEAGDAIY